MFQADIVSASTVALFVTIDVLIAAAIQESGCPTCGAALHASHYQRKARGLPELLESALTRRLSWCCSRDGCRHRVTPPSVRFLGRLVYAAPAVLAVLSTDPSSPEETRLRHAFECSRRSVTRWRSAFSEIWSTPTGRAVSGSLGLDDQQRQQPRLVLSRWGDRWPYVGVMWLLLIHPLTGGTGWEMDGQRRWPLDPQSMHFDRELRTLQDLPIAR
jgi:hypothetical protein